MLHEWDMHSRIHHTRGSEDPLVGMLWRQLPQKINSQQLPQIPLVTIMNAQKCPCLRRGCRCNYENEHPYHEALLTLPANISVVNALKETIERLENHVVSSNKREKELREKTQKIRMVSSEQKGQLLTKVKVGKTTITAVVDSGATADDLDHQSEMKFWCNKFRSALLTAFTVVLVD